MRGQNQIRITQGFGQNYTHICAQFPSLAYVEPKLFISYNFETAFVIILQNSDFEMSI